MRVVVLGSGVVGVASAWYLAVEGHEVVVVDRQQAAGMETSFANAGQVSPGYAWPWAAPGIPLKVAKWMLTKHSPFRLYPRADPAMWRWMAMMLRQCNSASYSVNKSRMVRVAEYSRECLHDLRHATGIEYDGKQLGLIQLFRTPKQYEAAAKDIKILHESGVACELLSADACVAREPGLHGARDQLTGGLLMPGDESGDAHIFSQTLASMAAERGVEFRFGATIEAILTEGDRVTGVRTDRGMATGDAYLVALGSHGARLLKPIGIELPVYPVKGYSITVPIANEDAAPRSTVADESYKVAITRLGNRIRAGGTAELSGYNSTLRPGRRATLEHSVGTLFAGACDFSKATFWTGLRPNTPDGTPIIGTSGRYENLWLNTGHGTLGWTMSCGSGRLVSDLISGRRPNIEYQDLSIERYAA